ncbi:MAG TPA: ABC transporter permease [Actinomycetes bacterium]|jgi:ABC-2 type transport system permease protein|nr:ABC transporter permease [Actinomycetes bacterium]
MSASLTIGPALHPTLATTFRAMLAREVRVMRRNFAATFLRVVLQPLLFVFVFAYVMPKIGASAFDGGQGGPSFSTILVPGMIGSAIIMQGLMAVIFPLAMELTFQRSIEDRALAPLPIPLLGLEKIVAAALQGLIGGLLVLPAVLLVHAKGQAPSVHLGNWPLLVAVMLTGALVASAGGLFLGTRIDPRHIQVLFALVLIPMTMLGCVYYPWAALHHIRWLQIAVLANPLVYVSEGLRTALTPQVAHMPVAAFLPILLAGTAALCLLATRAFARRVLT